MENKPKTALGLEENIESLLCYVGFWISGLLFLLLEKDNKNVRFHAIQSFVAFLVLSVLTFILVRIFFGIWYLLRIVWVCLWILLMVKAFRGERFKLPVIGDFAEGILTGSADSKEGVRQQNTTRQQSASPAQEQEPMPASTVQVAPPVSNKEDLLKAIEQALSQYRQLSVIRSNQTDLEMRSVPVEIKVRDRKKKVEYTACLLAKESKAEVIFWEMVKQSSAEGGEWFRSQAESFTMDKKVVNHDWDYEKIRSIIESAVKAKGWVFKSVLTKSKAMY